MKVLHVIPAVAPRYGGPSQAIFEMCRALGEQGLEVLLATTNADGQSQLPVQTGDAFEYRGVPTIFFPSRLGERFNYSPALASWLHENVEKFDVVHVHAVFSHPSLATARACCRHSVPYIVRPLGSLDPWSMRQKGLRKRLMWQMAAGRMLRGAAFVHYTTSEEKKLAESSLALDRGVVIPLGIDLDEIRSQAAAGVFREAHPSLGDKPYILALSRIHSKKNYELLIETFLSLAKRPELDRWRLVIAGDGDDDYLSSLRALSERLSGRDRVIFTGWLEGVRKASALQNASLFALPSQQENFAIAAAEALACGVPVLVSEHVNLAPEIVRARAGWVASLDGDDFSRALMEAMSDDDERERRGAAGKLYGESLSWTKSAEELRNLYSRIPSRREAVIGRLEERAVGREG
ncbi:MAG TPA: glycosyltransferase [Blastocatellia bacterium]|nr:glycosyltransferase [Blastocatellia bacterium]